MWNAIGQPDSSTDQADRNVEGYKCTKLPNQNGKGGEKNGRNKHEEK